MNVAPRRQHGATKDGVGARFEKRSQSGAHGRCSVARLPENGCAKNIRQFDVARREIFVVVVVVVTYFHY